MAKPQAPTVDTSDIDALHAKAMAAAPTVFAGIAIHVALLIARELRLLRAGVRP